VLYNPGCANNIGCCLVVYLAEVGAGAFFVLSPSQARSHKKSAKARQKKALSVKEKKREFALLPPSHTGNPVPEPKDARQGEQQRA
jgi:hypothetical protein